MLPAPGAAFTGAYGNNLQILNNFLTWKTTQNQVDPNVIFGKNQEI
jgi:hypothetical protein